VVPVFMDSFTVMGSETLDLYRLICSRLSTCILLMHINLIYVVHSICKCSNGNRTETLNRVFTVLQCKRLRNKINSWINGAVPQKIK